MTAIPFARNPALPQSFANRRLEREWKTVTAMIHIYCRDQHGKALCAECEDLARYVHLRLEHCRFGEEKPTCAKCPIHCYQRDRRARIKDVMRYAGPRMLRERPWLSLRHLLDGWLQTPVPCSTNGCNLMKTPQKPHHPPNSSSKVWFDPG